MKRYRCTVRFREDNRSRSPVEVFMVEAVSIKEAAKAMRDRFPVWSKKGHQGFKIEEVEPLGVRSP